MDSYTITIAPNDDSGAATRLVVDTSGDQVRITDVHLHAPSGLSSGHIPTVDFALLLQAVTGSGGQTAAGATALVASQPSTPAIEAAPEPPAPKRRTRKATPAIEAAPEPPAPKRRTRKATPAIEAAPEPPAPKRRARKAAPAVEAAPAKRAARPRTAKAAPVAEPRRRARTAKQAPAASGRVYRRTPDDLAEVFEQVETVAGVAEHYEVPRYTAQGWVNRLRATA